ncbi:MAG: rhomboid family intramembrane serine protease [Rhodothermales bacterium]
MADLSSTPITLIILVINVFVFGYATFVDANIIGRLSFRPRQILDHKEYYRYISAGFAHQELWHIAFNMLTLYWFGPLLEARFISIFGPWMGMGMFLVLYFGSELTAHALTMYYHKNDPYYSAIGASGAISGIVFAFCLYQPFAMLGIMFVIPMPAIVFAILYVVGSIYAMKKNQRGGAMGRIAHEAHLGGAIGGLLLTILIDFESVDIFIYRVQEFLSSL